MARVNFPKEALLVSAAAQTLVSLALRVIVIVVACLTAGVALKPSFGLVVIPVFGLLLFGTVVGTLLVPAGALFGDVQKLVLAMTTPLMLVAPVAYPPEAAQGVVRTLMELNPLTPLILLARALMLGTASQSWYAVLTVSLASTAGLLASWVFYRLAVPVIIEKLEA
jgi:lipopolysaccharide transport system permease protein